MKIDFNLNNTDLLTFQLFEASKSSIIKKKRNRNRFLVPLIYAGAGAYLHQTKGDMRVLAAFIIAAVAWVILYPAYSGWLYRKQFEKYIDKNFDTNKERIYSLELKQDALHYFDGEAEANFQYSEILAINELTSYFFIQSEDGKTVIVPKSEQNDRIKEFILELSSRCGIEITDFLEWKWK